MYTPSQNYGYPAAPGQPGSMAAILNNQDSFSAAVAAAQQQQQQQQGSQAGQGKAQQGQNGVAGGQVQQQALVGDEEYKLRFRFRSSPPARRLGLIPFFHLSRLLKNYKLAHLRIEEQRSAMLEQEKQVRPPNP